MFSKNTCDCYPSFFEGDGCASTFGSSGAMSYLLNGSVHYPHISIGNDDFKNNFGFHVTLSRGKHIFFKPLSTYPFCKPTLYDRVTAKELKDSLRYAREFALELHYFRV